MLSHLSFFLHFTEEGFSSLFYCTMKLFAVAAIKMSCISLKLIFYSKYDLRGQGHVRFTQLKDRAVQLFMLHGRYICDKIWSRLALFVTYTLLVRLWGRVCNRYYLPLIPKIYRYLHRKPDNGLRAELALVCSWKEEILANAVSIGRSKGEDWSL